MDSTQNLTFNQPSFSISYTLRSWYHALLLAPVDHMCTMAMNVQMNAVAYAYALDMIDLAPTCGKGYLRLASVYMQIGRPEYAVEAYHQGVLAVPRSDPYYGTLQERYENEQQKQQLDTADQQGLHRKNYHNIPVPRHIFISIFQNLEFTDRRRCMAVCKQWKMYLQDWSGMWENVDIRDPPRYHSDSSSSRKRWDSYQLYMRSKPIQSVVLYNADSIAWIRYSTTIKSITCHGGSISPDLDLSSAGTQLKTLELHHVQGVTFADVLNSGIMKRGYLESLVYHPYSNDNDVNNVVQEIPCPPRKQHQDGVAVPSLNQLNVTLPLSMGDYAEQQLRTLFPCLETLTFTIPLLGTLTRTYPAPVPKEEKSVTKSATSSSTNNNDTTVTTPVASIQFSKDAWQHDTEQVMIQSLSCLRSWQHLQLHNSKDDRKTRNQIFIPWVLKHCQNVHTLALTGWNITNDIGLLELQELRELTFQQCQFFTTTEEPDLVVALVQALPHLLRIDFQECSGVTQTSQQQVEEILISRNK